MDSYPNNNPDDERSYPAAPKGAGSGPDGVPLDPDHNPPSGGYFPNDEQWAGGAAFPLSSPYTGMSSGEPPAPIFRPELDSPGVARGGFPSRTDVGVRSKPTNRRRVLAGLAAFLFLVLVIGGLAFVLLGGGTGHPTANGGNTNNGGGAPVIVGTDTPIPTATLLPGQTPLPTAIPATPTPVLAPGQPTPTPLPYASSASVSFKRATQSVASGGSVTVSTGAGDSRLKVVDANDSASGNATATGAYNGGTHVTVTLSVTNNSGQPQTSSGGFPPIPGSNNASCNLQGDIGLAPGETRTQTCFEPFAAELVSHYDYVYTPFNLHYVGDAAAGGSAPFWYVPSGCGSAAAAQGAAKTALQGKLGGEMGGSTSYLSLPDISYSPLSCSPGEGQTITSGNTFTQTVTATGSQAGYFPSGVSAYQQAQVGTTGAGWQLIGSNGCSPSVQGGASLSSANIACQATGTEAWSSFNLGGMAQLIHGQTQGTATSELNAVQGVVAGSETYSLSGGNYLPTNSGNISFHYSP